MTTADVTAEIGDLCTLPTAERPLRANEFDDLFRSGVAEIVRIDDTGLELLLEPGWRDTALDLAQRETACCSFFTFTFPATDEAGRIRMRVTVPTAHVHVLDAMTLRAQRARGEE